MVALVTAPVERCELRGRRQSIDKFRSTDMGSQLQIHQTCCRPREYKRAARAAMAAVSFQEVAKTVAHPNRWSLVNAYRDAEAQKCVDDLLPRWRNRLGGAETFMRSHCDSMVEALNIDYGPD